MTVGWTAFVAWYEVSYGAHESLASTTIAVATKTAVVSPAIVIYAILMTVLMDLMEGVAVVTKRYLTNRFVRPLIERHKAEGRQEALEEMRDWNLRRLEAEKKGEPFHEPPPSV